MSAWIATPNGLFKKKLRSLQLAQREKAPCWTAVPFRCYVSTESRWVSGGL